MGGKKRSSSALNEIYIPRFTNDWVTPTKTRNAILHDYILDWLDLYGESKGYIPDTKKDNYDPELDFGKFIMDQGKKFEEYIVHQLKGKFGADFIEVIETDNYKKAQMTIHLMKQGTPIIYQGLIFNTNLKIYGLPDLIVRNDFLNKLVTTKAVSDKITGCHFNDQWHYRIIDIKFHTLKLKANYTTICNDDSVRAFKAQCYLYNRCLEYIQKYFPAKSYILGRGWNATKKSVTYHCSNPFNKLGTIDYLEDDITIIQDSLLAVDWYRKVKIQGHQWSVLPKPSVPEIFPNMNITSSKWKTVKSYIAHELQELTLIYSCGYFNRVYAHMQDIYKYTDSNCNAFALDVTGKVNKNIVDGILEANRGEDIEYKFAQSVQGFFVDIESVNSIIDIKNNETSYVYMIGVGYFDEKDTWIYKSFVAKSLDESTENQMITEFMSYLDSFECNTIWHYNNTDKNELCNLADKIDSTWKAKYTFSDVYSSIKNKVFLKGSFDFSIKSVVKALGKDRYQNLVITNGQDSIVWAVRYYEKINNSEGNSYLENIIKYNEADCIAVSDILRYLTALE
jgi:hypothetical protein